jgi:hypothetical protein
MGKLTITDTEMVSDQTRHTAAVVPGAVVEGGPTAWAVTWLPGRLLTRNQAITAMTIAEVAAAHGYGVADDDSKWRLHVDGWAAELGLSGPQATALASMSPEDIQDGTVTGVASDPSDMRAIPGWPGD